MSNSFYQRSIISIEDLTKDEILFLLNRAADLKKKKAKKSLEKFILASCFFESSTRTRLSFESAMLRLGGKVIGFSDSQTTSSSKGESLQDTIKTINSYADVIVLRHSMEGAARLASIVSTIPVINAGDGSNQHPTQTLLDLLTIKETQGKLEGINVAFVGDLKYGRTVHSLALAGSMFDMRYFFIAPNELSLPEEICHSLRLKGIKFSFHKSIEEVMPKIDILYLTRIQKERMKENVTINEDDIFLKNISSLKLAKKNLKILHPLPRTNELDISFDTSPYAYYFEQAKNGLYVRQALLSLILCED